MKKKYIQKLKAICKIMINLSISTSISTLIYSVELSSNEIIDIALQFILITIIFINATVAAKIFQAEILEDENAKKHPPRLLEPVYELFSD